MPPVGTCGDRGLTARDGGTSGRYVAGPLFDPGGLPDRAYLTPLAKRLEGPILKYQAKRWEVAR